MRIISTNTESPTGTQLVATRLGYAGLVPFGLTAVMTWVVPEPAFDPLTLSLYGWTLFYGLVFLLIISSIRGGIALGTGRPEQAIFTSLPVLFAIFAVMPNGLLPGLGIDQGMRFLTLLIAVALYSISELMGIVEWSPKYRSLRIRLGLVTAGLLTLTIIGLLR